MEENHFEYASSQHIEGVKAFAATMNSFSYDKHAHEEYSIGVTRKGRQDFFSGGAFHKSYVGNIIYFNPEQVHDGAAGADSTLEYDMLYIPTHKLQPLMQILGFKNSFNLRLNQTLFDDPLLRQQILLMCQHVKTSNSSHVEQESALISIAQSMVRLSGQRLDSSIPGRRKDTLLLRSQEFIISHLDQAISCDEMSQAANMSKYHYIRLFSQQFGMTPHQYLLNCRINRAREHLEKGLPVSEVAHQVGFADASHLNRKFKPVFGITPKQYQQQFMR